MSVLRLTLRQLQIFAAVAGCGSTTAASTHLALSQSATSSAINELERLLSQSLFDRSGKRLLLNNNGRALLPRAQALLDAAITIEQSAQDGLAQAHTLRIGASTTIGNYVLPSLLRQFLQQSAAPTSAWQSHVLIGNTEVVCDAVAAFELDVGLIEGPAHQPTLNMTPWLQDELLLVSAPDTPREIDPQDANAQTAEVSTVSLDTLRERVWLLREQGSGTRESTDQLLLPYLNSYQRSLVLGSSEAIKLAAAEGLGVACLSHWVVADFIATGRLQVVTSPLPSMRRQCYLVVHRDKSHTPALRHFVTQANLYATARAALAPSY
ncbi:LysR family transcriptional regulator [Rhodoferax sp. U11-2br]|uniref:LysR family transcriptional regulator n=1 Tax=Rhodoferax sp. U11-2br TaxID=2838878 RepID=UPI001BE7A5FB|nr:LysR family transcriptional regulator [Rhodoferax sp. U11-2br]MBT3066201.1 LysR family transcriptional regulator [Rhodoferax sp. U11-2br]